MKTYAQELGIHFLFLPPGLPDELQPLDRFALGAMNGICFRASTIHCRFDSLCSIEKQSAAVFLIRAWEGVSTHVLEEEWSV
jgi:hypothetical protein